MDLQKDACGGQRQSVHNDTIGELDFLEQVTCRVFGLQVADIRQKSRKQMTVKARQTIYYVATEHLMPRPGLTITCLAARYGQTHATAIHGKTVIRDILEVRDPAYYGLVITVERAFRDLKKERIAKQVLEPEYYENVSQAAVYFAEKHNVPIHKIILSVEAEHDKQGLYVWEFDEDTYCMNFLDIIKPYDNGSDDKRPG